MIASRPYSDFCCVVVETTGLRYPWAGFLRKVVWQAVLTEYAPRYGAHFKFGPKPQYISVKGPQSTQDAV
jgi:hypothetical protein